MAGRYFTLPDSQYSRESQYVPLPFDRIMAAAQGKQRQYDKEKQDVIDILGKSWNRLPGDIESSLKAKQEIDKQLQDFTGKDLLDPSIRTEWHKTKQQILNRFGPMGDIGNIQGNYDAYKEYEKHIIDKADKLGWGEDTLRNELDKAKNEFSTLNPKGGFNQFKGRGIATRVDPNERIGSYVKEAAYQQASRASDYLRGTNDPFTYVATDGSIKTLPREQIIGAAYTKAQGDSELQKSLRQEEQFYGSKSGLDNDALINEPILDSTGKPTGKTRLRGNTGTILGSAIEGVAREKAFTRDETNYKFLDNFAAKEGYKKKLEQEHIALTSNVERAGFGSTLSTPKDVENKVNDIAQQNQNIINNARDFRDANGNKVLFDSQATMLDMIAKGRGNFDITQFHANDAQKDVILKYMSGINQNNKIAEATKKYDERAKVEAGLDKNYTPDKEIVDAAEKNGRTQMESFSPAYSQAYSSLYKQGITSPTIEQMKTEAFKFINPNSKEQVNNLNLGYEKAKNTYNDVLAKEDPRYKKYHEILKKNAETSTETLGVTSFTNTEVEKELGAILTRDLTEGGGLGAKDLRTGKDLKDLDTYAEIGKVDPNGIGYYYEGNVLHLVARPLKVGEKEGGAKTDYIDMVAPHGTDQYVLKSKNVTDRQIAANNILKQAETSPDMINQILVENEPVTVRKLTNEDIKKAPANTQYEIRLGDTVKYYSKDGALKALTNLTE